MLMPDSIIDPTNITIVLKPNLVIDPVK
jgi:hypothetical protein